MTFMSRRVCIHTEVREERIQGDPTPTLRNRNSTRWPIARKADEERGRVKTLVLNDGKGGSITVLVKHGTLRTCGSRRARKQEGSGDLDTCSKANSCGAFTKHVGSMFDEHRHSRPGLGTYQKGKG